MTKKLLKAALCLGLACWLALAPAFTHDAGRLQRSVGTNYCDLGGNAPIKN